jgi:Mitochondrial ribosomal protein L31
MLPKDKYTVFSRNTRGYRKGIHKVPKFTRVSSFPYDSRVFSNFGCRSHTESILQVSRFNVATTYAIHYSFGTEQRKILDD